MVIGNESLFMGVVVRGGRMQGDIQARERQVLESPHALGNNTWWKTVTRKAEMLRLC